MSDRPTPEDDQTIIYAVNDNGYQVPCVDLEFARQLKRERDEARRECKFLWDERDEAMELLASEKITRNHIIKRSVEVEKERDEAREVVSRIEEIFINGGDTYLDFVRVGNIARDYLKGLE